MNGINSIRNDLPASRTTIEGSQAILIESVGTICTEIVQAYGKVSGCWILNADVGVIILFYLMFTSIQDNWGRREWRI